MQAFVSVESCSYCIYGCYSSVAKFQNLINEREVSYHMTSSSDITKPLNEFELCLMLKNEIIIKDHSRQDSRFTVGSDQD